MDFTAAIRAYNAADRLPTILTRLQEQTDADAIAWEVLIVDNNSRDGTAAVVDQFRPTWPDRIPLRYVNEAQQGASYARRRAIDEAQGTWIGFLDDDNWPAPNWVRSILDFAENHPRASVLVGQIHGQFEVEPPKNFQQIAHFLPVIERSRKAFCYNTYRHAKKKVMPPGAGMAVKRQVWLDCVPKKLVLKGPVGSNLTAKGEDIEALLHMVSQGWEVWFNPDQHIDHHIPRWRFERAYLLKFFRGVGLGRYQTRKLSYPRWKWPLMVPVYFANDLRKWVVFWWRHRRELGADVVAASQMEMLTYTLISPFYLLRQRLWRP